MRKIQAGARQNISTLAALRPCPAEHFNFGSSPALSCRTFQLWQQNLQINSTLAAFLPEIRGFLLPKLKCFARAGWQPHLGLGKMDGTVGANPTFLRFYPPHTLTSLDGSSSKTLHSLHKYRPHFIEVVDGKCERILSFLNVYPPKHLFTDYSVGSVESFFTGLCYNQLI